MRFLFALWRPKPLGAFTMKELAEMTEFQRRKQPDALPCMRDARGFSAASFIKAGKWMPRVHGGLTGGVK